MITHEYRVHSSTLLAPPTTASSAMPIGQQDRDIILALRVQSSTYPDSIMLYYRLKAGQPHPLGLLPDSEATFHSLLYRTSKNGNIYCESTASSSITLHLVNTVSELYNPYDCRIASMVRIWLIYYVTSYLQWDLVFIFHKMYTHTHTGSSWFCTSQIDL